MEIWLCTLMRCFSSSYIRHISYALSSNPGPTAECTFIAAPMTACPISSSITFASFAYPSRPLRYLSFARFLSRDRGGRIKGRDTGAGGAHALGKRALRHQLGVNEALLVILAEDEFLRGAGRRGERADHLLDLAVGDQGSHVGTVRRQGRAAPRAV